MGYRSLLLICCVVSCSAVASERDSLVVRDDSSDDDTLVVVLRPPLYDAIEKGEIEAFSRLLEQVADLDMKYNKQTLLRYAMERLERSKDPYNYTGLAFMSALIDEIFKRSSTCDDDNKVACSQCSKEWHKRYAMELGVTSCCHKPVCSPCMEPIARLTQACPNRKCLSTPCVIVGKNLWSIGKRPQVQEKRCTIQ